MIRLHILKENTGPFFFYCYDKQLDQTFTFQPQIRNFYPGTVPIPYKEEEIYEAARLNIHRKLVLCYRVL